VFLVIITVLLNLVFIPMFGINGAAFATFISVVLYNSAKLLFVNYKFKIQPFSSATAKTFILILVLIATFYFWEFPFHPLLNIALKSVIVSLLYFIIVYKFELSEDISTILNKHIKL